MSEKSDDSGLFSPVVLGFLIAAVVAIFALSALLTTIGSGEDTPFRATVASPSAIGHKGFYTLLEKLGFNVVRTRINEQVLAGRGGLLIVDEPELRHVSFSSDKALGTAPNVLLVLPKWHGHKDFLHDGWVRSVDLLDLDETRQILALVDSKAKLVREKAPAAWPRNRIGIAPAIDDQVQLITGSSLRPLVGSPEKLLLGEHVTRRQRIWVLADPDPLENHGIAKPANAAFAVALVDRLRSGDGRIVFDEAVHDAKAPERNFLQLLFQFPYVIVTAQILVALLLLLLATTSRFGGAETVAPPFALGKTRLIDNIASLMDRAGHQAVVLRRYLSVKLGDTGRALHAPSGLDDGALARWLDRVGTSRGVATKATAILERSAAARGRRSKLSQNLFDEARDMYRWSKDLLDGSGGRQDDR